MFQVFAPDVANTPEAMPSSIVLNRSANTVDLSAL